MSYHSTCYKSLNSLGFFPSFLFFFSFPLPFSCLHGDILEQKRICFSMYVWSYSKCQKNIGQHVLPHWDFKRMCWFTPDEIPAHQPPDGGSTPTRCPPDFGCNLCRCAKVLLRFSLYRSCWNEQTNVLNQPGDLNQLILDQSLPPEVHEQNYCLR